MGKLRECIEYQCVPSKIGMHSAECPEGYVKRCAKYQNNY